jgi:hypothetical protein
MFFGCAACQKTMRRDINNVTAVPDNVYSPNAACGQSFTIVRSAADTHST